MESRHLQCRSPAAMSLAMISSLYSHRSTALEENDMTATYTFDVFSRLDGYGGAGGNWTGYWGKQSPQLLDHPPALYGGGEREGFWGHTHRGLPPKAGSRPPGARPRC